MLKITIDQALLLKALAHTQSIVERRQTIPVLSNVLIETNSNGISLKATDNEIEIAEIVPAEVEEEGAITIPAHKLYDIVRRLPDCPVGHRTDGCALGGIALPKEKRT